jgi:hypothetical protein
MPSNGNPKRPISLKKHRQNQERKRSRSKKSRKEKQEEESSASVESSNNRQKKQRWTELTAVGHILADQVHIYTEENKKTLSNGERRHLEAWENAVQKQIHHHSALVLENVTLVSKLRQSLQNVENLRDDCVILRTQARKLRQEATQLENKLDRSNQDSNVKQGASRFLFALEHIGKACRGEKRR